MQVLQNSCTGQLKCGLGIHAAKQDNSKTQQFCSISPPCNVTEHCYRGPEG